MKASAAEPYSVFDAAHQCWTFRLCYNKHEAVMDWDLILSFIAVLFAGGIFLIGFLSLLLVGLKSMLKPIEKQLTNHVTDTDNKIVKLAKGQNKLAEGQVRLEAKLNRILEDKKA